MDEIEDAAFAYTKAVDDGEKVIVGVNRFVEDEAKPTDVLSIDPQFQVTQAEKVRTLKAGERRDNAEVEVKLADVRAAAEGTQNLLYPMREALAAKATLGEVSDVLRDVFGQFTPRR